MLLVVPVGPATGHAQTVRQLQHADRVRLAEGRKLAAQVCGRLWPGWGHTTFQTLLVADSVEFLVAPDGAPRDFARLGYDSLVGAVVWTRPRHFPPNLLATFPAVGGVPTIVIGSAERTGKSSTAWVMTLLHEHFHQWQYARPDYTKGVLRLGLTRGDSTGQWMLNYPFPYDSVPVQRAMRGLAAALLGALHAHPGGRSVALQAVIANRDTLRTLLAADDYRYLQFQLWQEGVARFTEYAVARAARARRPSKDFRSLPDNRTYQEAAEGAVDHIERELEQLDLAKQRRVAFYPIGAAWALLLDATRPDWKQAYIRKPFVLPDLPARRR
jgi:hypothetical protein